MNRLERLFAISSSLFFVSFCIDVAVNEIWPLPQHVISEMAAAVPSKIAAAMLFAWWPLSALGAVTFFIAAANYCCRPRR